MSLCTFISSLQPSTHLHATVWACHLLYLGEELSRRSVFRWKRDGARHTAKLVQVIWLSATLAVTSLRKHRSVCRASRASSGSSSTAARTACRRCSFGMSERGRERKREKKREREREREEEEEEKSNAEKMTRETERKEVIEGENVRTMRIHEFTA